VLLRLLPGETVVGATCVAPDGSVLLATALGRIKRLAVAELRLCQRGDLGQIGLRFLDRGDRLVDLQGDTGPLVGVMVAAAGAERNLRLNHQELALEDSGGSGSDLGLPAGATIRQLVPLNG
jgi:DNA gyrase subunit A